MSSEGKSWPEVVGKDANEIENQIKAEGYNVEIKPDGAPCTRDYRVDRVRIFVDDDNKIIRPPTTG